MINKIKTKFPHFSISSYTSAVYVADYTEYSKKVKPQRGVEITAESPTEIESFQIANPNSINFCAIPFSNDSFVDESKKMQTQCELLGFPNVAWKESKWILLVELKYCNLKNRTRRLHKAFKQLDAVTNNLESSNTINKNDICYWIVSLPLVKPPFQYFISTPPEILALKRENIIYRETDEITIIDTKYIQL